MSPMSPLCPFFRENIVHARPTNSFLLDQSLFLQIIEIARGGFFDSTRHLLIFANSFCTLLMKIRSRVEDMSIKPFPQKTDRSFC